MSILIELSGADEEHLRREWGDLERAAKEALVIESYRTARVTLGDVAALLGLESSIEAQAWLAARGVLLNYALDDLEEDRRNLAALFPDFEP